MTLPVLYSLRNCPFAMRARIAIYKSALKVEMRELILSNKPTEMIAASPKATVPIVVLPSGKVIDESVDVMLWALNESDPGNLLRKNIPSQTNEILDVVQAFDQFFKPNLEAYKCAKRYHENNLLACREHCETHIQDLEKRLSEHEYVIDNHESMADIAILPFIRQFAKVERTWYVSSQYIHVKAWLNRYLQSVMFTKVMSKYPLWIKDQEIAVFGCK